ncbi:hypothetical protein HPB48_012598 [Haemaphysalis longicornis]|uniref:Uncharacterized protein n=1 Tax=Haemaphysalis longicornis TaxID=44386 RepID=A0A9J6G1W1_HAELO|nr:hypothetical protein HPB48_012598 [Haemaphysalis longicornis]
MSTNDGDPPESVESEELSCSFTIKNLALPSAAWGKHTLSASPLTVAYSVCRTVESKHVLLADKLVLLSSGVGCVTREVFVKGVRQHDVACDDPALLLGRVDAMSICSGAGTVHEFSFVIGSNKVLLPETSISSKKCQGVSTEGKPCVACRHLRKALLNQRSRKRRSLNEAARISKRRGALAQTTRRLKAKLSLYTRTIEKLKQQSGELKESALANRLESLPPKQRLAVMQCFQEARRK